MTDLEKAQRDASHARDELQQATMLLARVRGQFEADALAFVSLGLGGTEKREALRHDINKFMRRTSLFPQNA